MTRTAKRGERKQEILEHLVKMLEQGDFKITTARLAEAVGVSEAALYRHFPSKGKMFEGLIVFIEESIFSRVNQIVKEEASALRQCEMILTLLLMFVEKNPGFARLLTGEALVGENDKLRQRISQFFDRIEAQLKQVLRDAEIREGIRPVLPLSAAACLLLASAEGRIAQFARSQFKRPPTESFTEQWEVMTHGFFRKTLSANF